MVDTAPAPATSDAPAPLPPLGRPAGLGPDHEPGRRPRRGSWLITRDGERYLDYSSGIGVTNTGHAHPRVVAAIQEQAAKIIHSQQNITYHEPGLRLYDRLSRLLAGRGLGRVPVELRRGGDRGVGQAGPDRDRAAGDHRVPLRLPRPDRPDDGADDGEGRLPRPLRAAAGVRLPHGLPVLLSRAGRGPRPGRELHLRLGGPARPDVPPDRLPEHVAAIIVEPVLGEGGYIVPPPASCRASARSPRCTGSC